MRSPLAMRAVAIVSMGPNSCVWTCSASSRPPLIRLSDMDVSTTATIGPETAVSSRSRGASMITVPESPVATYPMCSGPASGWITNSSYARSTLRAR